MTRTRCHVSTPTEDAAPTLSNPLLVTGTTGYLGHYLLAELERRRMSFLRAGRAASEVDVVLDLEEPQASGEAVRRAAPDAVLHAAALSSIAECEADHDRADRVNHLAVAEIAAVAGRRLTLVSTDLVFDGRHAPYGAAAQPTPLSEYGRSKVRAERVVLERGGRVVRIPLLFGPSHDHRRGATDMIRHASGPLTLFRNEIRTPLHVADAARALIDLLLEPPAASIVHAAGAEPVSRWELGRRFLSQAGLGGITLQPGESCDPRRPLDVSLTSDVPCRRSLDEALRDS